MVLEKTNFIEIKMRKKQKYTYDVSMYKTFRNHK